MRFHDIEFIDDDELTDGAASADLDAAERRLGTAFPAELRAFLQRSDGYDGELADASADEPSYIRLHPVDEIVARTQGSDAYADDDVFPGAVEIGDDGGDESLVYRLDTEGAARFAIVDQGAAEVIAWVGATFVEALHGWIHRFDDEDDDGDDVEGWPDAG